MTNYMYLDEMQNLCLRLSNAFKVTRPDDQVLIDLYDRAEEGFFRKKETLEAGIAKEEISEAQIDRVLSFQAFVEKTETEAAYKLKEENDARESERTTA